MRKYQPVWNALKEHGTISLSAEPDVHTRIILAVRKEKCRDLAWKLANSEAGGRTYKLLETVRGKLITFTLVDTTPDYMKL